MLMMWSTAAPANARPVNSCANLKGVSETKNISRPVVITKMPAAIVAGVDHRRVHRLTLQPNHREPQQERHEDRRKRAAIRRFAMDRQGAPAATHGAHIGMRVAKPPSSTPPSREPSTPIAASGIGPAETLASNRRNLRTSVAAGSAVRYFRP